MYQLLWRSTAMLAGKLPITTWQLQIKTHGSQLCLRPSEKISLRLWTGSWSINRHFPGARGWGCFTLSSICRGLGVYGALSTGTWCEFQHFSMAGEWATGSGGKTRSYEWLGAWCKGCKVLCSEVWLLFSRYSRKQTLISMGITWSLC